MNPLLILLIGLIIVIGMIVVFRVNAFIALITAAITVSLLSEPLVLSSLPDKMGRVATSFGSVVGAIGIVIALAAVIGKCMMDSGAADRIVRAFLSTLGEKRTSVALMGSGFVLAIPVFFDTVFYLLVPLARSLWRRTHKNYLLYILAISTGGAITHTLVPPTPGPLFMANLLDIDLGVMMMMGAAVALPTAIVGLWVCGLLNRMMDVPMRPYAGEPEPDPLKDEQLPGLFVSLLPVLLPVVLISANTLSMIWADAEHAAIFRPGDLGDASRLASALANPEPAAAPLATRVLGQLPSQTQEDVRSAAASGSMTDTATEQLRADLNTLLGEAELFDADNLATMTLPPAAAALQSRGMEKLTQAQVERFNRLVLETAYPDSLSAHVWDTPRRKATYVTALLGNPNMALLLSAVISMVVLVRSRKLSFAELGQSTETALMSGGVIILITAGGGAFGAMLREAGVRQSIEGFIRSGGAEANLGLAMVLAGFGVAAVLKIAQGSSTVAMITAASMFAAMGVTSQMLGFHCVYLATAIGCGSLFGSWMNDSGFWIFARMGNLTEVEALKSWTILLAVISVVGLGVTLLFATLLPLV